jgi:hypothetical protein
MTASVESHLPSSLIPITISPHTTGSAARGDRESPLERAGNGALTAVNPVTDEGLRTLSSLSTLSALHLWTEVPSIARGMRTRTRRISRRVDLTCRSPLATRRTRAHYITTCNTRTPLRAAQCTALPWIPQFRCGKALVGVWR